jgi:uncharacterized membrane protein
LGSIVMRRAGWSPAWPAIPLGLSAIAAFVWILHTQLLRLYGLTAPSWDLGQEQQLLWSLATGHGWASSYEFGENFLGIHLEPILLPIAAAEWIWPTPIVPLVFSAAGLAATAPAAFLMLRALLPDRPGRTWLALALAAPMPFWAATQEAARDQFHPENLALALAMLAAWAGLTNRRVLMWILVLLVLCCKEDQTYTAFVIGFLIWREGSPAIKRHGRVVMFVAVIWLVVGAGLIQFMIRGLGYSPDVVYYGWILNPIARFPAQNLMLPDPWLALLGLLVSMLGLPLLAPRWLLLVLPPLAANLLTNHDPQQKLQLHYVLLIMFPMILAAGFGARQLLSQDRLPAWLPAPMLLAGALPALILGFTAGKLPPAMGADPWLYNRPPASDRLLTAAEVIPRGAPVYADDGVAVWLTDRTALMTIPDLQVDPDRYIVIDRLDWYHRDQLAAARAAVITRVEATGRQLLYDDGRFQVWSPVPGTPT